MYNMCSKGMVLKMCLGDKNNVLKFNNDSEEKKIKKVKKYFLNNEQKRSFKELKSFGNKFNVSVLQGVTGSGKTLVYFEIIKEVIQSNKQALVLLPEIFLTNQFKYRFLEYFGFEPSIWHSKTLLKKKREIWRGVINNKVKLIVGARSSLLLPFKKLGIIIVDEEHDASYKQDESIIYHARDMAISRASFENIPTVLVTSVPSLETFNHIQNKKYNVTKLKNRFSDFPLPKAKIIQIDSKKISNKEFIAQETLELIKEYLNKDEQVLFF